MHVKLLRLQIVALYGHYNYDVTFNSDVTFIYGENGCGKTTILNITEAIITGTLYKLFPYKFTKIVLEYAPSNKADEVHSILLKYKKKNISVTFNGAEHTLNRAPMLNNWEIVNEADGRIDQYYFTQYDFLDEIRSTFNYVYLPLNRSQNRIYDSRSSSDEWIIPRSLRLHYSYDEDDEDIRNIQVSSLEQAVQLIRRSQRRISVQIGKINDEFRNKILKASLFSIESAHNKDALSILNDKPSRERLVAIKNSYIMMMREIVSVSEKETDEYSKFFDEFIDEYIEYKNNQTAKGISIKLLLEYQDVKKTERLVRIAEEAEKRKNAVQKPIELFLNTMNDFIGHSEENKKLHIDSDGGIYLSLGHTKDKISIQQMSSGEKQLLTFFAHLIFAVKEGKPGIFVVDEPELSLHLSWQKMFVEKALSVNSNIQLIFATHAPEIIGRQRDKMFKLTKEYTNKRAGDVN